MKLRTKSLGTARRLLTLTLALIIALTMFCPVTAQAKTKNSTFKNQYFSTDVKTVKKKSGKLIVGTNNVTIKKVNGWSNGYGVFVAPASKTYKFTISSLRDTNNMFTNGHITPYTEKKGYNRSYMSSISFKQKGKSQFSFHIASSKQTYTPTSMSGTIKLSKGDAVYIYFSFLGRNEKGKITSKLVIK